MASSLVPSFISSERSNAPLPLGICYPLNNGLRVVTTRIKLRHDVPVPTDGQSSEHFHEGPDGTGLVMGGSRRQRRDALAQMESAANCNAVRLASDPCHTIDASRHPERLAATDERLARFPEESALMTPWNARFGGVERHGPSSFDAWCGAPMVCGGPPRCSTR
jgi:hypothetical protein